MSARGANSMTEQDVFPTYQALTPGHLPRTGAFERQQLFQRVVARLEGDEWVAIWAPRYSGRTTFLRRLEAHYRHTEGCLSVYTLPNLDLIPAGRSQLFSSFAEHFENA